MESFDNWREVKRFIVAKFSDWSFSLHNYSLKEQLRLRQKQSHLALRNFLSVIGRRRRLSGRTKREIRHASNFLIQGTCADIAKAAMVRLHAVLPEGARLISIVHDEFIVECRQEQAEDVRLLMVETMQTAPEGFVAPMVVEAKIAANWGDAK